MLKSASILGRATILMRRLSECAARSRNLRCDESHEAVRNRAKPAGMPYQRFIRAAIKRALHDPKGLSSAVKSCVEERARSPKGTPGSSILQREQTERHYNITFISTAFARLNDRA